MLRVEAEGWIETGIGTSIGLRVETMNHNEAVQQMAAERYLLDELTPEARDAFEEHMFDCPQCSLDVRAGAAFVDEAKVQLPEIAAIPKTVGVRAEKSHGGVAWWRPAFIVPAFAALLLVVGYQNLITIPSLHTAVDQPRIVPNTHFYGATRGAGHQAIAVDRAHGVALSIDIPLEPGIGSFASYAFSLDDPDGKQAWSGSMAAPSQQPGSDLQFSVVLPGKMLRNGKYTLTVTGIGPQGEKTQLERQVFDVALM